MLKSHDRRPLLRMFPTRWRPEQAIKSLPPFDSEVLMRHAQELLTIFALAAIAITAWPQASAQEWAKKRLDDSPRHLEWVNVKNGDRTVKCFVAYPEVKDKATAVIVIHEIFGLS